MATVDLTKQSLVAAPALIGAGRFVLTVTCGFAAISLACHGLVAHSDAEWASGVRAAVGVQPNTLVFAGVGGVFGLLTWLAHLSVIRAASRRPRDGKTGVGGQAALMILVLPMAIRFGGTFLVLAGLLSTRAVEQNEAVFDVLFWYVTLTTIEVVGIVWASKSATSLAIGKLDSAMKGV